MKIENFLSESINVCIENSKFKELPIPTIARILDQGKENVDHNLLLDFILESAPTRFFLFKFISIEKLKSNKIDEIIQFIDKQDEKSKELYLDYMPINISLIKHLKNKYDCLLKEMNHTKNKLEEEINNHNKTKEELKQEKENHDKTKEIIKQEKAKHEQTINELKQEKINHNKTKEELKQEKENHDKTKEIIKQEKINHNKTKEELDQFKRGLIHEDKDKTKTKNENKQQEQEQAIIFAGIDINNILGNKPNNKNKKGSPIIFTTIEIDYRSSFTSVFLNL